MEYTQDGIIYRFTPESNAWKITIKNNTNKNARINWEKGSFIINGKASGISLYPFTSDDPPTDVIKEKSEITRTVTASNLIKGKKVNKIEYMEKLRFIADTDWQSNVDRRPSISLQIAFTIYFINLFPFY